MANVGKCGIQIFGTTRRAAVVLGLLLTLVFGLTMAQSARAQTYAVIYDFTGGVDGANPYAGLSMDKGGNLYGTTYHGGAGFGTVYQLRSGSSWFFSTIYSFAGGNDGAFPYGRVVFGPNGLLFGTTSEGGNEVCNGGCGTVFSLRPPPNVYPPPPWTKAVLYRFTGTDGAGPSGDLTFDQAGNLYGTTFIGGGTGGNDGAGLVYELTTNGTEKVLYDFPETGCIRGADPFGGVIFDNAGNLYGATRSTGAYGCGYGVVFQLTPSGAGWSENVLYTFQDGSDGAFPFAGLTQDSSGNLYGASSSGGQGSGGTVFELTPSGKSWALSTRYAFSGSGGPQGSLIMDQAGNFYGTTTNDGKFGLGSVFKLTPSADGWIEANLYSFSGGTDGANPYSNLVIDASGNLYGTTFGGGVYGKGVVFKITLN